MWTWDASAPGAGGSGVCDDEDQARRAASAWMRAHGAAAGVATQVRLALGAQTLMAGHEPTGVTQGAQVPGRAGEMGVRPRRRLGAPLKRDVVAGIVRDMIADGSLEPGSPVPSAAELARKTGYTTSTCRSGPQVLLADGAVMRGVSPTARLWVPRPGGAGARDADALGYRCRGRSRPAGAVLE